MRARARFQRPRLAAIGAIAVLACAACGDATTRSDTRSSLDDASVIAAATQDNFEAWAGDVTSLQAAAFVKAYGLNGLYSRCLNDLGYDDDWEVAVSTIQPRYYFGQTSALTGPDWRLSDAVLVNASVSRNEWRLHEPAPSDRVEVENGCRSEFPGLSDDELQQIEQPTVVSKLSQSWEDAVTELASSTVSEEDIYSCFESSQLPDEFSGKSPDEWFEMLDESEPEASRVPVGSEAPSAEWQHYLDVERVILDAAWECHSDTYGSVVAKLPELVASFEADHAPEIEQAKAHWAEVQEEARELGWSPDRPQGTLATTPSPAPSE